MAWVSEKRVLLGNEEQAVGEILHKELYDVTVYFFRISGASNKKKGYEKCVSEV